MGGTSITLPNSSSGSGAVLQVKSLFDTTPRAVSVSDTEAANTIPNFNLAITPTRANSKILISVCMAASVLFFDGGGYAYQFAGIKRNGVSVGNLIGIPNYDNINGFSIFNIVTNVNNYQQINNFQYIDTPNTTEEIIYSPSICQKFGFGAGTIYFNRDEFFTFARSSSIVLMEIAP